MVRFVASPYVMRKKSLNVFLMFLLKTTYHKFVLKCQHLSKFRGWFAFMETISFWGMKYCSSSCISGTHQNAKISFYIIKFRTAIYWIVKKRFSIKLKCNHSKPSPINLISIVYYLALFQPDFCRWRNIDSRRQKSIFSKQTTFQIYRNNPTKSCPMQLSKIPHLMKVTQHIMKKLVFSW